MTFSITQTWLEISQNAFEHNIIALHAITYPQNVRIAVVVKANAYGHGLAEIAQLCEQNRLVHMLCAVSISEALHLRSIGITKPILVLGIFDQNPALAIAQQIELVVHDQETALQLNALATQLNTPCFIHIKVDTGLSRLGIAPENTLEFIRFVQTLSHIHINGICSHFAESGSINTEYTLTQYKRFKNVLETLKTHNIHITYRHIANSAGSLSFDLHDTTLIRVGACAYGLMPSQATLERIQIRFPDFTLQPIMSWHTRIMHIRTLPAGTPMGYERTFTTSRQTTIALLPVGYTDGYSKSLSNKAHVLLPKQNTLAPVVGRIAMNITTIDVTDIPNVTVGDEVMLLGNHPMISATHLANLIESYNPREFTAGINASIKREVVSSIQMQKDNAQKTAQLNI